MFVNTNKCIDIYILTLNDSILHYYVILFTHFVNYIKIRSIYIYVIILYYYNPV